MANENVPAPTPTRSDDQILPFAAWVHIGKINFVSDLQKKQKNPIFHISVDILQNTNFFRAFTTSASIPTIYIQYFWNTLTYEAKTGAYKITPIDQAHQFVSPPSGDAIMDFVNELGYTEEIHFVSRMAVNNLYQPWRAILSMINQCLTGKTSGYDRPRYPVLQMLWGIITSINVDYAELMWEEFVQVIQTFLVDKTNLSMVLRRGRRLNLMLIPYCQFTKLIICHLGRTHNIHQRSASLFHLAEEDHRLGHLKFVPKGEEDEHDQKIAVEGGGKKKPTTAKQLKLKPVKEKSSKLAPAPKPKMSLESFQAQGQAHVGGVSIREHVAEATRPLPVVEGKGKAITTEEQAAQSLWTLATEEASTGPSTQPQDDASANIVYDSPSPTKAETGADIDKTNSGGDTEILQIGEEQGEDVANVVDQEEKTAKINKDQVGSDPGKTP
ncbi:hypothetical protein Tco_1152339 [Tanacetum coccineum]